MTRWRRIMRSLDDLALFQGKISRKKDSAHENENGRENTKQRNRQKAYVLAFHARLSLIKYSYLNIFISPNIVVIYVKKRKRLKKTVITQLLQIWYCRSCVSARSNSGHYRYVERAKWHDCNGSQRCTVAPPYLLLWRHFRSSYAA